MRFGSIDPKPSNHCGQYKSLYLTSILLLIAMQMASKKNTWIKIVPACARRAMAGAQNPLGRHVHPKARDHSCVPRTGCESLFVQASIRGESGDPRKSHLANVNKMGGALRPDSRGSCGCYSQELFRAECPHVHALICRAVPRSIHQRGMR